MTQLLLLRHLQSLLCTIIQKRHGISHRHLTEGTGASEAGLILQRSIGTHSMVCALRPGPHSQTERQLVLLDLSIPVDITVAQQDYFQLVQLFRCDTGL